MDRTSVADGSDRRGFLKNVALLGGAVLTGLPTAEARQSTSSAPKIDWRRQLGMALGSAGNLLRQDYEGTIAKLAQIGFKELEGGPLNNMEPKALRALFDRHGLTMPSLITGGVTEGPGLEKQLEGFQTLGVKYTTVSHAGAKPGGGAQQELPAETTESMKREVAWIHQQARITAKFGMKVQLHNHPQEFTPLADDPSMRPYDYLLQTDPSLVAMELDLGWATVSGLNIPELFRSHPGRFELWHTKDMHGPKYFSPQMTQFQRQRATMQVPVGLGEVDFKLIFANAQVAGLKHFYIEQDTAAAWGNALSAIQTSYDNLYKLLS